MPSKSGTLAALALAGLFAAGAAQARDGRDLQWSLSIGTPIVQWQVAQPGVRVVVPVPVYPRHLYHASGYRGHDLDHDGIPNRYDRVHNPRWDHDGDGIPNRHDRVYNPRWDRDGDGIPNRHDRVYNPRWDRDGDGIPNRHDRVYNPRWDRDGDGIPNRHDPRPGRPGR